MIAGAERCFHVARLASELSGGCLAFRSRQSLHAECCSCAGNSPVRRAGREAERIDPVTRIFTGDTLKILNWARRPGGRAPGTMIRWHRAGWKLFWRLKARPGRPPIPNHYRL